VSYDQLGVYGSLSGFFQSSNITYESNAVVWDGKNDRGTAVAPGVYLYEISIHDFSCSKKMILTK